MLLCSSRVEVEVIVKISDHISCSFDQLMSMSNIRDRNSSSFSNLLSCEYIIYLLLKLYSVPYSSTLAVLFSRLHTVSYFFFGYFSHLSENAFHIALFYHCVQYSSIFFIFFTF